MTQGGRDHSSHRLVYYGLSERQAVALLAVLASAARRDGLAYNVLDNGRVTTFGVLVTFVVLVQFASFLGDLEDRSRRGDPGPPPARLRAFFSQPRRLIEVLVDFALICASFLAAYLLFVDGEGTEVERAIFLSALPVLLGVRYVVFVLFGIYRRIWRFAGAARRDRDRASRRPCPRPSRSAIVAKSRTLAGFPLEIFVVDALLCTTARRRFTAGPAPGAGPARSRPPRPSTRILIVGAGRSGRGLARELREAREHAGRGLPRRQPAACAAAGCSAIKVLGGLDETRARCSTAARPDEVLVTIPTRAGAPQRGVASCAAAGSPVPLRPARDGAHRSPLVEVRAE